LIAAENYYRNLWIISKKIGPQVAKMHGNRLSCNTITKKTIYPHPFPIGRTMSITLLLWRDYADSCTCGIYGVNYPRLHPHKSKIRSEITIKTRGERYPNAIRMNQEFTEYHNEEFKTNIHSLHKFVNVLKQYWDSFGNVSWAYARDQYLKDTNRSSTLIPEWKNHDYNADVFMGFSYRLWSGEPSSICSEMSQIRRNNEELLYTFLYSIKLGMHNDRSRVERIWTNAHKKYDDKANNTSMFIPEWDDNVDNGKIYTRLYHHLMSDWGTIDDDHDGEKHLIGDWDTSDDDHDGEKNELLW
jgi:hypothetical protein